MDDALAMDVSNSHPEDIVMLDILSPFICSTPGCGQAFECKRKLVRHQRRHSNERPFVCGENNCGKSYQTKAHLDRHLRMSPHGSVENMTVKEKKVYSCSFCEKQCKYKFDLRIHEAVHTGDKPLKCHVCGASFALPGRLKSHLKTHKSYPCSQAACDFVATKWTLLRKHLIEHKICCQFCSRTFTSETVLKKHEADHSQDFQCPQCPQSYSRKANLKTHIRTSHDKVFFKCSFEGCEQEFAHRKSLRNHFKAHSPKSPSKDSDSKPKIWRKTTAFAEKMSGFEVPQLVRIEILEEDKNFRRELISQDVEA